MTTCPRNLRPYLASAAKSARKRGEDGRLAILDAKYYVDGRSGERPAGAAEAEQRMVARR